MARRGRSGVSGCAGAERATGEPAGRVLMLDLDYSRAFTIATATSAATRCWVHRQRIIGRRRAAFDNSRCRAGGRRWRMFVWSPLPESGLDKQARGVEARAPHRPTVTEYDSARIQLNEERRAITIALPGEEISEAVLARADARSHPRRRTAATASAWYWRTRTTRGRRPPSAPLPFRDRRDPEQPDPGSTRSRAARDGLRARRPPGLQMLQLLARRGPRTLLRSRP